MTEHEYREYPAISRSALWKLRESPEKFKWAMEHPEQPTQALLFGQAFHKLVLEPETFFDEFAVAPEIDRRTKAGKEEYAAFCEFAAGKTVIDQDAFDRANEMRVAVCSNPYVAKLLNGQHEVPYFWTDELTGEACKVRLDSLTEIKSQPVIVDLKTTADASTDGFMRSAIKYGYDFQAAMYSEGYEKNTGKKPLFVFIAIEKEPPYAVNILQADEAFTQHGYDVFRELIGTYHDCKASGNWFGYLGAYNVINTLNLPAWVKEE